MTTQMIREAIETLHQAFEEFKSTNEERLTHLETKGKNEPFLDEKMNRLNATLDKAQDRLTHLETASRRPFFSDVVESMYCPPFSKRILRESPGVCFGLKICAQKYLVVCIRASNANKLHCTDQSIGLAHP